MKETRRNRHFDVVIDGIYRCLNEKETADWIRSVIKSPMPSEVTISVNEILD